MCYNLVFYHIAGEKNAIADCMSRLTRRIREAEHFLLTDPILADYSIVKKIDYNKHNTVQELGHHHKLRAPISGVFGRLHLWSSSFLVVFVFGSLRFWSSSFLAVSFG